MKDAFHGSARPGHGLDAAPRDTSTATVVTRPYHGSSVRARRRGTAHTAPIWIRRAGGHCFDRPPRIVLDIDVPWGAIRVSQVDDLKGMDVHEYSVVMRGRRTRR